MQAKIYRRKISCLTTTPSWSTGWGKSFSRYDTQYDILPELEFELSHGRAKPDIAICEPAEADWLRDVIRPTTPPLLAVEILSPRQALSDLTDKVVDVYFFRRVPASSGLSFRTSGK